MFDFLGDPVFSKFSVFFQSPKEEHSGDEAPVAVPKATIPIPAEASSASPSVNNPPPNDIRIRNPGAHPPSHSNDKVMIVSGDSQNMVVDLSAVPLDLREAIISGTAILALPDELNQRLEPGYTMIAIPQDHEYEILPSPKNYHPPHPKDPKEGSEGRDNYATKNLAQVWDVMQHKSKGKRITTVLPFHPNQDSHVSLSSLFPSPKICLPVHKTNDDEVSTKKVCNFAKLCMTSWQFCDCVHIFCF